MRVRRLDAGNAQRVNVGGSQAASYLLRLLQLKYPGHLAAVTLSRMEELLHEHSYTAVDYHKGTAPPRRPQRYSLLSLHSGSFRTLSVLFLFLLSFVLCTLSFVLLHS